MPSTTHQTATALITAFNKMDIDTIISLRTPSCMRVFLPSSLNYPPQNNDTYRANLEGMKSIFSSFEITVDDIVEGMSWGERVRGEEVGAGEGQGEPRTKIVMYIRARGDTPVGEYKNEYVWKMGFDESGEKVNEWVEYVDVGMTRDFYPLLKGEMVRRRMAAKGEGSAEGVDKAT